jgi:DNA-binding sugar fermentation-stimulating protein
MKSCEEAYQYMKSKGTPYQDFMKAKARMEKAVEELSLIQASANQSMAEGGKSMMNPADAKSLQEKLSKMSDEEKRQWAMQNAKNFMPTQAAHVNQDINNKVVTETAQYLAELEAQEMESINAEVKTGQQIQAIEAKYQPLMEQESKDHDWGQYAGGEGGISPEMEKKYAQEHAAYRKHMTELYTKEMNEKLAVYNASVQNLIAKYKIAAQKIESTHYGDDAKEPANRNRIIHVHSLIATRVLSALMPFENVFKSFAENYVRLYELEPIEGPTE